MNKDIYLILTQITVILHFLFVIFVIAGGFLVRKKRWIIVPHLGSVFWALYAELSPGVICPLTSLENYFGYRAGLSTYQEDFITRYLVPIIYQESLTTKIQLILVGIVVIINLAAYQYSLRWKLKGE